MLSFFGRNKASKKSGSIAKDRLQLVLIGDRTNISPEVMEMLKGDIIKVISNYVTVDTSKMDFKIIRKKSQDGKGTVASLEADIPIMGPKRNVK